MSGQGVQGAYGGTRGLRCRNMPVDKVLVTSRAGQLNMFSTAPLLTAVPRSFDSDHSLICDYHHTFVDCVIDYSRTIHVNESLLNHC